MDDIGFSNPNLRFVKKLKCYSFRCLLYCTFVLNMLQILVLYFRWNCDCDQPLQRYLLWSLLIPVIWCGLQLGCLLILYYGNLPMIYRRLFLSFHHFLSDIRRQYNIFFFWFLYGLFCYVLSQTCMKTAPVVYSVFLCTLILSYVQIGFSDPNNIEEQHSYTLTWVISQLLIKLFDEYSHRLNIEYLHNIQMDFQRVLEDERKEKFDVLNRINMLPTKIFKCRSFVANNDECKSSNNNVNDSNNNNVNDSNNNNVNDSNNNKNHNSHDNNDGEMTVNLQDKIQINHDNIPFVVLNENQKKNNDDSNECDEFVENECIEKCSICLCNYIDDEELRILPCLHEFHKCCIDPWISRIVTCPLCRYDITIIPSQ